MDEKRKEQFILDLAKELVISGKYPMARKEIMISNIAIIPKLEKKYEPLLERQKTFISGLNMLVDALSDLYDSLLNT